jgi:hypothetical protein
MLFTMLFYYCIYFYYVFDYFIITDLLCLCVLLVQISGIFYYEYEKDKWGCNIKIFSAILFNPYINFISNDQNRKVTKFYNLFL